MFKAERQAEESAVSAFLEALLPRALVRPTARDRGHKTDVSTPSLGWPATNSLFSQLSVAHP